MCQPYWQGGGAVYEGVCVCGGGGGGVDEQP